MRASSSIAPENADVIYLVLDDLGGRLGRTWRETDEDDTLIRDMLDGHYSSPPGSSPSTQGRDGRGTQRKKLLTNCAPSLRATLQPRCRTSLVVTQPSRPRQLPRGLHHPAHRRMFSVLDLDPVR
jgi:hypothetical protein